MFENKKISQNMQTKIQIFKNIQQLCKKKSQTIHKHIKKNTKIFKHMQKITRSLNIYLFILKKILKNYRNN